MTSLPPIERFDASNGARIYRLPMVLFPNGFVGYSYLVFDAGPLTLIDAGSGWGRSNQDLLDGLAAVGEHFGEKVTPSDIRHIIVTHGHIDHFGGVAFIAERAPQALIGIHELDRRVLTAYEERVVVATKDLRIFLARAGVKPALSDSLIQMYGFAKKHVASVKVDFALDDEMLMEGMSFIHTPGHCPGQVCVKIGDILLSADHVLSHTTPHQAPESITHYTGLGHYKDALRKLAHVDGIRLALGGHEDPIEDLYGRIKAIHASHDRKLNRICDIIREHGRPMTISDISKAMYPERHNYDILLAIEESGAHVEYLYQHGLLSIANLDEVEKEENPALLYQLS